MNLFGLCLISLPTEHLIISSLLDFVPWRSGVLKALHLAVPAWCPAALTSPLLPTAVCPQMLTLSWCISAGTSTTSATDAS